MCVLKTVKSKGSQFCKEATVLGFFFSMIRKLFGIGGGVYMWPINAGVRERLFADSGGVIGWLICMCCFVPHCECGRMSTEGCIVVGQGIVCLIHCGVISAHTEPSFFLPTTRGGLPSICHRHTLVTSLVPPLSASTLDHTQRQCGLPLHQASPGVFPLCDCCFPVVMCGLF